MESVFQFSNPMLLKLDFSVNQDFENNEEEKISLSLKLETQVAQENEDNNEAFVVLCVTVGEKTNEFPFYVYAEEAASFRWEKEAYSEEALERLLKQNAPALLLSYLRPIIANITNSSPYTAYDIPFMNFKENG